MLSWLQVHVSVGFRSGQLAGQSSTVTSWSLNNLWYLWQCGQVLSPAGKLNQHLHKACQQKEAWSALNFLVDGWVDFWKHSGPTLIIQHCKSTLIVETSHWTPQAMWILSLSTLTWKINFKLKKVHWANSPVHFCTCSEVHSQHSHAWV